MERLLLGEVVGLVLRLEQRFAALHPGAEVVILPVRSWQRNLRQPAGLFLSIIGTIIHTLSRFS